ncbi:MAG: MarR family transcriptional regulator [Candidatus Omnitrophica bacterium]|nr:MarR family transcriptional regulator [Candidatus Omnitrophota bacterium]
MKEKEKLIQSFREMHLVMSRLFNQLLGEVDLTFPQYVLLGHLSTAGSMTMTEASEKLYISKPAVTSLVDKLAEEKYLARKPHPEDRRAYHLTILQKGQETVKKFQETFIHNLMLKTLEAFKTEERESLQRFMDSVLQNADEILANPIRNRRR